MMLDKRGRTFQGPPSCRKRKKMEINKLFVLILLGIAFTGLKIQAQDIVVTGDWHLTIDALDLQNGAGSGLKANYKSAADAVRIDVSGTTDPADDWRLDIAPF